MRKHLLSSCCVLVIAALYLFLLSRDSASGRFASIESPRVDRESNRSVTSELEVDGSSTVNRGIESNGAQLLEASMELARAISGIEHAFKGIELGNTSNLERVVYEDGESLYLKIEEPNVGQLQNMYAAIESAINTFDGNKSELPALRERATKLLNDYSNFPTRFRVVSLGYNSKSNLVGFSSRFVDVPESALPDEKGIIRDRGDGSLQLDWDWRKDDSVFRSRFGHLFSLSNENQRVASPVEGRD